MLVCCGKIARVPCTHLFVAKVSVEDVLILHMTVGVGRKRHALSRRILPAFLEKIAPQRIFSLGYSGHVAEKLDEDPKQNCLF